MSEKYYMVVDVESIGLHGEGFSVGFVVMDGEFKTVDEGLISTRPEWAEGTRENLLWVQEHVTFGEAEHHSPYEVRRAFWKRWMEWKGKGALLWADCLWPVEGAFLSACVKEESAEWDGPYPFFEIASLLLANGMNPIGTFPRLPSELPAHNALNDARQSARILAETLVSTNL